jgi:hypothetical protein
MIMFVSDESLTKVRNPVLKVGYETPFNEFSTSSNKQNYKTFFTASWNLETNEYYYIAA